jgi:hypothetical protein
MVYATAAQRPPTIIALSVPNAVLGVGEPHPLGTGVESGAAVAV